MKNEININYNMISWAIDRAGYEFYPRLVIRSETN
jgi:hypothetical protein